MKLTKTQGSVDILNASDKLLVLLENMRLYNGYQKKDVLGETLENTVKSRHSAIQ